MDALRFRIVGMFSSGCGPGERVGTVYPTSAEFFHAFFGVLLAGAVPVPLYPPVRLGRLAESHARTAAGHQQPARLEAVHGLAHDAARDAVRGAELRLGGQPVAGRHRAALDARRQAHGQTVGKRLSAQACRGCPPRTSGCGSARGGGFGAAHVVRLSDNFGAIDNG